MPLILKPHLLLFSLFQFLFNLCDLFPWSMPGIGISQLLLKKFNLHCIFPLFIVHPSLISLSPFINLIRLFIRIVLCWLFRLFSLFLLFWFLILWNRACSDFFLRERLVILVKTAKPENDDQHKHNCFGLNWHL